MIPIREHRVVYRSERAGNAAVTVCVPLFNYERLIEETLDSVAEQDLEPLDLVVVDDDSTDRSMAVAERWLRGQSARFGRASLIRQEGNAGLSRTRNTAVSLCRTPYYFPLDADNLLYPRCLSRCLEAIEASGADFAYPILEVFGDRRTLIGYQDWSPERLARGNYIDAMALIRVAAWETAGGYSVLERLGWEDWDLWCKLAELGGSGVQVPEILARYREHDGSMLRAVTQQPENARRLESLMARRHPWVDLTAD